MIKKIPAENFVEWQASVPRRKIISFEIPHFLYSTILSSDLSESDSPVDINYNPVIW